MAPPRIVLLHATPVAIPPITAAFKVRWPEAETVNLLDDSLSPDRARDGSLTPAMMDRFASLGRYAHSIGADGILVTCSAFGPAIERLARELPIPVIKPNEAMFAQAVKAGDKIGMLATFRPTIETMDAEFREFTKENGLHARIMTILVEGAMDKLRAGDADAHNRLIGERAQELASMDAVMLAHFSTSSALGVVSDRLSIPVFAAPEAAVDMMRAKLS